MAGRLFDSRQPVLSRDTLDAYTVKKLQGAPRDQCRRSRSMGEALPPPPPFSISRANRQPRKICVNITPVTWIAGRLAAGIPRLVPLTLGPNDRDVRDGKGSVRSASGQYQWR